MSMSEVSSLLTAFAVARVKRTGLVVVRIRLCLAADYVFDVAVRVGEIVAESIVFRFVGRVPERNVVAIVRNALLS